MYSSVKRLNVNFIIRYFCFLDIWLLILRLKINSLPLNTPESFTLVCIFEWSCCWEWLMHCRLQCCDHHLIHHILIFISIEKQTATELDVIIGPWRRTSPAWMRVLFFIYRLLKGYTSIPPLKRQSNSSIGSSSLLLLFLKNVYPATDWSINLSQQTNYRLLRWPYSDYWPHS